jgi:ribosomal protein S18 acetylase RimI-like enzyme
MCLIRPLPFAVAISMTDLEAVAAATWRAPDEERLGGWLLRAAGGFTGRANSALAVGEPGLPLPEAAAAVAAWYAHRGLPAMISVCYPAARPGTAAPGRSAASGPGSVALDRFLAGQGWTVRAGPATVMTAATTAVERAAADWLDSPADADFADLPDGAWLGRYHYRGTASLPAVALDMLTSAPWQAFGSIRADGQTVAIGRVAGSGDWAGLTAIEVDPAHRRRGLATAITRALAAVAAEHGARQLFLQVADDNAAARALYLRIGFANHHGYHYRVSPG